VIAFPGGVEEILRAIARDKDVDVLALAKSFGVSLVGPTPFLTARFPILRHRRARDGKAGRLAGR
jgi:hypothetical protein